MTENGIKIRGAFRIKIVDEDGSFAGDSGWQNNTVVNLGFLDYVVKSLGSISGSKYLTHLALGTGGTIATDATALAGEVGSRTAITAATSSDSKTLRLTATFASGWHTSTGAYNISNIGLFNTSSGGTIFAGNTFASSSCASNQAVNTTYDIILS